MYSEPLIQKAPTRITIEKYRIIPDILMYLIILLSQKEMLNAFQGYKD